MYIPTFFEELRIDVLQGIIVAHPLGTLFTNGVSGLDANHLPFELSAQETGLGVLLAHVARKNPVWQDITDGDQVLVVFSAGDAYVSPNWYPSKHELHNQVPTWNYRVVHAHGKVKIRDDERFVRGVIGRLTRTHEASEPVPWKVRDLKADALKTKLKAIVGLEIEIVNLTGKFKLGQNKEERDIRGAGEALKAQGSCIGDAMLSLCVETEPTTGKS